MVFKLRVNVLRVQTFFIVASMFLSILTAADEQYQDHGWAKLESVRNKTPHDMLFYAQSRGLMSMLPEGSTVRIKALKTGFGNYYKVEKNAKGTWTLKASTRDSKDPASQFIVSYIGKGIAFSSEIAQDGGNGMLLASSLPSFDVGLISDKVVQSDPSKANMVTWELVEDPMAGDTLETCYIRNKATGGLLTASYDVGSGGSDAEISDLRKKIDDKLTEFPYISIVSARVAGMTNKLNNEMSVDITEKVKTYVKGSTLKITNSRTGTRWVEALSERTLLSVRGADYATANAAAVVAGAATLIFAPLAIPAGVAAANIAVAAIWAGGGRNVEIQYREGDNPEVKTLSYREAKLDEVDAPLELTVDESLHMVAPLKARLAVLEIKTLGSKGLKTSDVARTGYEGTPFELSQWSKIAIESVIDVGDYDDAGADKQTIAAGSSQNLFLWAHKRPSFMGFGEQKIPEFGPEMVVTTKALYSKGFAWIEEALPTAGQGIISFRALADEGDVQVCFSDSVKPYTIYRIVFGAAGNTKTIIYKNNIPVQEISNEQNENARLTPGMIEKLWVSLNKGFIIVGKGDPGEIVIMAWQDPNPSKGIERVGFSTFKSAVKYTDVQKVADPIVTIPAQIAYVVDTKPVEVGTKESPVWSSLPISPADAGTVVFQATGSEEASLILANEQGEGYIISFGADGNTCTKILDLKEGGELYGVYSALVPDKPSEVTDSLTTEVKPASVKEASEQNVTDNASMQGVPAKPSVADPSSLKSVPPVSTKSSLSPLAILDKAKPNKFWVSYYRGRIILGKGDIGKNPFCIYVDKNAPKEIGKIAFAGKATIQNLEIWPEVDLGLDQAPTDYVKQREYSVFKGALNIISPYSYGIYQQGPTVTFKDNLTGMQWKMAGVPDPAAQYTFMLDVESDGTPNLKLLFQDPSAETIKVQGAVTMAQLETEASMRMSQNIAYATGPDPISSMVAIGISSAAGAAGAGWSAVQATQQTKLMELQALANRYIYSEQIDRQQKGQAEIRTEAQRNRQTLESKLEAILQLQLQDAAQLDYATKQWDDVLRLVTDFYVVDDSSVKRKLSDGIKEAYDAVKGLDLTTVSLPIYNRMMNCLMKAYNNAYLTKAGNAEDDARKKDWYLWINTLSQKLFDSTALMASDGIDINFKGEYLWLSKSFAEPGRGSITFEAKATSNIFVALSENPYQVRNRSSRMYEIVIGKWDNKTTAIHRKSLGDEVIEFEHSKIPALTPDPMNFKKYWINLDNGKISGGVGELGQNKLWEWQDPYTAAPVKCIGFSNWLSLNTYRNIKVDVPFVAGSGFKPVATESVDASADIAAAVIEEPVVAEESVVAEEPVVIEEPVVVTPAAKKPVVVTPAAAKPAAKKPVVAKPSAKPKTVANPVAKKSLGTDTSVFNK